MSNKVGIDVAANLDTSGIQKGLMRASEWVDQQNKKKLDLGTKGAVKDMEALTKAMQSYFKIRASLGTQAKASGQAGVSYEDFDWAKAAGSQKLGNKHHQDFLQYIGMADAKSQGGSGGGVGQNIAGMAMHATQTGMRATGPVGRVAASALGTTASDGFGPGLMGLMGGMLALGVGKLVSSAMEKITQAENNSIALDTLKRTLGDVNVSFNALKSVVKSSGDNLGLTYDEAGKLSSQFVKLGNVTGEQYKTLNQELGTGVGLSRAFGMDPAQGVQAMGQMRGVGMTSNPAESRRLGLLIGETIGKSGAFAKADEVMGAITTFAESQTRNNVGRANVEAFAGMFSGLVGSGMPGLDVQGASALLSRVNSSLSAGGAHGEGSQFFTSMVGGKMGLDPVQTQILREGGAFATNDKMFGEGSAAARFGIQGPKGDKTFLQETMDMLKEKYGHNKGQLAMATANHLGLGINQAMALSSIDPKQMGEMQKYADLGKLDASGIGNLTKVVTGTDADRRSVADTMLGRKDVSKEDKASINNAMGTDQEIKVLSDIVARYSQEKTQGSDIRESRAHLDNIKTNLAERLIPLTEASREALVFLAGKQGMKDPAKVAEEAMTIESVESQRKIKAKHDARRAEIIGELDKQNLPVGEYNMQKAKKLKEVDASEQAELGVERASLGDKISRNRGGSASGVNAPEGTDPIMKQLMGYGWTKEQAQGITANLVRESSLKADAVGDNGKAYGLAQWHPDRQAEFKKLFGKDIQGSSTKEQVEFLNHELTAGKEKAAGDMLRKTETAREAASVVSRKYERPKEADSEAYARANIAENIGTPMPDGARGYGEYGKGGNQMAAMIRDGVLKVQVESPPHLNVTAPSEIKVGFGPATPDGARRGM